jgi:DNA-binding transcriptional LysR family regulator
MISLMANVELRHLATMTAIAEEGSFGRAAHRLGYTQSSVSQQIAVLEQTVGGPVFDRPGGPRPVRITPLGAVVLDRGRDLLAKAEELAQAIDRFKAGDGRIDIGTLQSVSNVILPSVVHQLRSEHPGCEIRLSEEEPEDPQIGDLDLLFYDGRVQGDVDCQKLVDDPYLLVTRPGDLPEGPVGLKRLDGIPMVAWPATCDQPPDGTGTRTQRRPPADRVPHCRQRNHPVDGPGRPGIRSAAMARPPWSRRLVRRPAAHPQAAAITKPRDLPPLARPPHPVPARQPGHPDRRRSS